MSPRLHLSSVTKYFGTTAALRDADLSVRPATIHALLGANGAGKTTLMHVAFGLLQPDHGSIELDGTPVQFHSPAQAIAAGIGMVHQHFTLVPAMSVAENIALGGHGQFSRNAARKHVTQLANRYGFALDPDTKVETLSVGAQQRVEILKALARDAKILILDEPTAVLSPIEARQLLEHLRQYVTTGGTVILITHKLRDALKYADDITVLRNGRTVFRTATQNADEQQLAESMLGEWKIAEDILPTSTPPIGPPILGLDQISYQDKEGITRLHETTLNIYSGEIVGIAAIDGNGQNELLRILAGRIKPTSGKTNLPDEIGFIPEDRHRDALVLDFTLAENIELANIGQHTGLLDWPATRAKTQQLLTTYDIQRVGPTAEARSLSGGNQQRLVLARELSIAKSCLIAENPTRGLDIRATSFVHQQIHEAKNRGLAIVVYSSDLDEVLSLADRIFVLHNGTLQEVPKDRNAVGLAMLGNTPATAL